MDHTERSQVDQCSKLNFSTVKSIFGKCKTQERKVLRQNDMRRADQKSSR